MIAFKIPLGLSFYSCNSISARNNEHGESKRIKKKKALQESIFSSVKHDRL
jgi:hypothetical protein